MKPPRLFLASQSVRRKQLLKQLGVRFSVVKSDFKEKHFLKKPAKTVLYNAKGKVRQASVKAQAGIVLGADTIVYFNKKILGKPKSREQAIQMVCRYAGKSQWVYSGLALFNLTTKQWKMAVVKSRVVMKKYDQATVKKYLSRINPLDKAGGYAVQERGDQLIRRIVGSYTNVVGLPVEKVKRLLGKSFFPTVR